MNAKRLGGVYRGYGATPKPGLYPTAMYIEVLRN